MTDPDKLEQQSDKPISSDTAAQFVRLSERSLAGDDVTDDAVALLLQMKNVQMRRFQTGEHISQEDFRAETEMLDRLEEMALGL